MRPQVVNTRVETADVYIGRSSKAPADQHYGNPFSHKPGTLAEIVLPAADDCIDAYSDWLCGLRFSHVQQRRRLWILQQIAAGRLAGKSLGCYCAPKPCHGDVLANLAETWPMLTGLHENLRQLEAAMREPDEQDYSGGFQ